MCMDAGTPPARNLAGETQDTLQAQINLAPQQFAAESKYSPQYSQLAANNFMTALGPAGGKGLLGFYQNQIAPALTGTQQTAQSGQRGADLADLQKYGAGTVAAIRGADPRANALMDQLNEQASSGLAQGATLDPSLRREVQQSVRAGQSARGFGLGPNDVADEALFTGLRADQLRRERQGFATQVAGMNQAGSVDPLLAVLGRPSTAVNPALLQQGAGGAQGAKPTLFDPMNPYAADLYNTNYNGRAAANIAGTNASAQVIAGGLSAL